MPRFKGSCGCYNREDARQLGLAAAVVWNDMLDRAEHFDANPMWYDQKEAANRLGMSETSLKRAVDKLVDAERITKRKGYRPGTTISTTWITIFENVNSDTSRKSDLTLPRKSDLVLPILNDTKETDLLADEGSEDTIPLAQGDVQAWLYDTDENGKTIAVEHTIHRRDWNKAVRKWREDEGASVLVTLKDTGATERMTFKRIKKFNVRPSKEPKYKKGGGFVYAK